MSSTEVSSEHTTQIPTTPVVDLKLEVVVIPVSDVDRVQALLPGFGLAARRRFRVRQWLPRRSVHAARLGVLGPIRHEHDVCRAWLSPGPLPGRLRDRGGTRGAHRPWCRDQRGVSPGDARSSVPARRHERSSPRARRRPRQLFARSRRSAIRTATAGCFKRSKRGFPGEDSATWTSRR